MMGWGDCPHKGRKRHEGTCVHCVATIGSDATIRKNGVTDRNADRQTNRQTDRQTDKQTDRQADRQIDRYEKTGGEK